MLLDERSSLLTLPSNNNNDDGLDGGDGSNNGGVGGKNVIEGKRPAVAPSGARTTLGWRRVE